MTVQESVISIFEKMGLKKNAPIPYKDANGKEAVTTVEGFGYIISQADIHGVTYVPILEAFEKPYELLVFASNLIELIYQAIAENRFTPITAESLDLYDMEDWED